MITREQLHRAILSLLDAGDPQRWKTLPHATLMAALEHELRFLGLYAHEDTETPALIHTMLEEQLDAWVQAYSWITVQPSPFLLLSTTATTGVPSTSQDA